MKKVVFLIFSLLLIFANSKPIDGLRVFGNYIVNGDGKLAMYFFYLKNFQNFALISIFERLRGVNRAGTEVTTHNKKYAFSIQNISSFFF